MSRKVYYAGKFPPPYGGVTVKNELLYRELSQRIELEKIPFHGGRDVSVMASLFKSREDLFLIGFGSDKKLCLFLKAAAVLKPSLLSRVVLIVMGGTFAKSVTKDRLSKKACRLLRRMYVETDGMRAELTSAGLFNVELFPNCRSRTAAIFEHPPRVSDSRLECVFFSRISPEKGADIVLDTARKLPDIGFTFYGQVDKGYLENFKREVASLPNVTYKGVFDSVRNDPVAELSSYDLHLFPTCWPNEGVPGVLVETKMAAVPSVVSDICYNAELVLDGKEGVVLKECDSDTLAAVIGELRDDPGLLDSLKAGAFASSERFCIDRYIDLLMTDLVEAGGESNLESTLQCD